MTVKRFMAQEFSSVARYDINGKPVRIGQRAVVNQVLIVRHKHAFAAGHFRH
jgi:hypothetical protein